MNAIALREAFDGRIPAFMLRGLIITASNPDCRGFIAARRGPGEAQDGQEAAEASEPETAVSEAPSPVSAPGKPTIAVGFSASEAEREAALAELAALSARNAEAAAEVERLAGKLEDARQGVGSGGLALTVALRQLMQRHNLRPVALPPLPLAEPVDAQILKVRGIAATGDVDLDRTCFRHGCWPKLDPSRIRLLMNHDENRVAGTIDTIDVDHLGRVVIVATITNKDAMRLPALSISAMVEQFTIERPDSASFVGEITRVSDVNEISLSTTPANRQCLILDRWIPSALELSNQALLDKFKSLQATVTALHASGVFARAA
jgi:hypothetical protein